MFKKLFVTLSLCLVLAFPCYAQKGGRSGGGSSFSGSKSGSSFSGKSSSSSSFKSSSSSSKSSTSGSSSFKSGSNSSSSKSGFGSSLTTSQKKDDSKASYTNTNKTSTKSSSSYSSSSSTPKSKPSVTYKAPGSTKTYTPPTKQVNTIKSVPQSKINTYSQRQNTFYSTTNVYNGGMSYGFNDHFSPFLMGWMFSEVMNTHDRALWMYHHEHDMDSARYREMLAKDAQLEAEIAKLKAENIAKDPSYVPEKMKDDPDLMYSEDYVKTVYNYKEPRESSVIEFVNYVLFILVVIGFGLFFIWILFLKDF